MSTPNLFREPSQSSRMLRLLMFLPPVILDASTTLFRRPEPFLSHLPIISSVAPSGRVRSDGMGYCSAVSIRLMPPSRTPRPIGGNCFGGDGSASRTGSSRKSSRSKPRPTPIAPRRSSSPKLRERTRPRRRRRKRTKKRRRRRRRSANQRRRRSPRTRAGRRRASRSSHHTMMPRP